jgi:hypothetical protein
MELCSGYYVGKPTLSISRQSVLDKHSVHNPELALEGLTLCMVHVCSRHVEEVFTMRNRNHWRHL